MANKWYEPEEIFTKLGRFVPHVGPCRRAVQTVQAQHPLHKVDRLAKRDAEQNLHRQAGLDRCTTVVGLPTTLGGGLGAPCNPGIKPARQQTAAPERLVGNRNLFTLRAAGPRQRASPEAAGDEDPKERPTDVDTGACVRRFCGGKGIPSAWALSAKPVHSQTDGAGA
jgi:hypothetical protein